MNKKKYQGHYILKKYGQHFLINPFIIENIINIFNPKSNQTIIEIGPGFGALTLPISKYIKNIIAIELDLNLVNFLIKQPNLKNKLTIIHNNAMNINFNQFSLGNNQSLRILGNLPYNTSINLLFHILNYINIFSDMHFMLQKEVANRLIAQPNSKAYGYLSIMTQYYCEIFSLLEIPPSAFIPVPKVNSTMLCFVPHKKNPYPKCNVYLLKYITKQAFNQRRKIISNSLKYFFQLYDFEQLGINHNSRAENITIENYCKLANKFWEKSNQ